MKRAFIIALIIAILVFVLWPTYRVKPSKCEPSILTGTCALSSDYILRGPGSGAVIAYDLLKPSHYLYKNEHGYYNLRYKTIGGYGTTGINIKPYTTGLAAMISGVLAFALSLSFSWRRNRLK